MENTHTLSSETSLIAGSPETPETPALAAGVVLAGEMPETGFVDKQWLVVRNGKFIQLGEILYRTAELVDGKRTLEEIAEKLTNTTDWMVSADNVRQILQKLIPLGIIAVNPGSVADTGAEPAPAQAAPARDGNTLGITMRTQVLGPQIIQPIARVLQVLYRPVVLIPMLILMVGAHLWMYLGHGLSQSFMDILYRPWGFPIILGLLILAGVFHEFGHASALVYGGGYVRGMGAGIYFIYPAFFTDLTDSYRLGRWARVRTDLGGFYFYLIFALGIMGVYLLTGYEFLLLVVLFINLDILYQSLPIVRMDGYWVMADLTGIPDPLTYMKTFLVSLVKVPGKKRMNGPQLRPRIRNIFLVYTLLMGPLLIIGLGFMIYRLPRFVMRLFDSVMYQLKVIPLAWQNGDFPGVLILAMSVLMLSTMIFGSLYIFFRIARDFLSGLWKWSLPTLKRRMSGAAMAVIVLALLSYTWLPHLQVLAKSAPEGVQAYEVTTREHTSEPVSYAQSPPVGGDHAELWQNCGFYDEPIQSENAVHSMEHGAVWVTYRPDLPENQVAALRQIAYRQPYVLVSPYPDLQSPVVASAWGYQIQLESAEDIQLEQFIRTYRVGEQAPEAGEACIGGVGSPK